jgi:hypothetical protein
VRPYIFSSAREDWVAKEAEAEPVMSSLAQFHFRNCEVPDLTPNGLFELELTLFRERESD